jgi:hypothetical protein
VIQLSPQTVSDNFPVYTGASYKSGNQVSEFAKLLDNFNRASSDIRSPEIYGTNIPAPYVTDNRPQAPEYHPETPKAPDPSASADAAGKARDADGSRERPAEPAIAGEDAKEAQKAGKTSRKSAKPSSAEDDPEKVPGFEDGILAGADVEETLAPELQAEFAAETAALAAAVEAAALADAITAANSGVHAGAEEITGAAAFAGALANAEAGADGMGVEAASFFNKKAGQKPASGEAPAEDLSSAGETEAAQAAAFDELLDASGGAAGKSGPARLAGEAENESGPDAATLKKAAAATAASAAAERAGEAAAGYKVPGTEKRGAEKPEKEEQGGPEKSRDRRKDRFHLEVRDHRTQRPEPIEFSRFTGGDAGRDAGSGFGRGGETEIIVELPSQAHSRAETAAGKETRPAMGFQDMLARELHQNLNNDIVRHASIMLRDGGEGTIRMTLKPESLGNVKIRLEMADNKIAGHIIVESNEALRAFEQEIQSLEQAFRDSGFEGATLEMAVASDGGQDGRQWEDGEASPFFSERLAASNYEAAVIGITDEEYLWLSGGAWGDAPAQINMLA